MFKILVVEDEEGIRTTIVDILELADYDVLPTANGKEALQVMDRFVPDLIISDVNMPEMDGFELLLSLRRNRITQNIPCIFLTARVERKDFRYGMSIGADDYLTKPFTSEELLTAVHTRLERHKLLLSEIVSQVQELQLLRQMDQELSERLEPRWLMNMIFDWALRQSNANTAILFLKPTPDSDLQAEHVYGRTDQLILREGDTWGIHPLTDTVLLTSKTLLINNLNEVQGIAPIVSASQSVIAVPIIFGDVPMGVIVLESERKNDFDEATVNLLEQMANRASVALQNARLFQQLNEQRKVEHNLRLLFQKFVSEEVATALEDETVSTDEINTKVAILFCDIRNFTVCKRGLKPPPLGGADFQSLGDAVVDCQRKLTVPTHRRYNYCMIEVTQKDDTKAYISRGYRIAPNDAQHEKLQHQFGCVRVVFNHFLWKNKQVHQDTKSFTSYQNNAKALTQLKRETDYRWLKEVHSQPLQQSLKDLDTAFKRYRDGISGKPKFKRKGH